MARQKMAAGKADLLTDPPRLLSLEETPKFKPRLDRMAPQERKVLHAMARFGDPITPRQLAIRARIFQHNQVSVILGRLVKKGYVVKLDRGYYGINDCRLYQYLRVRDNLPDEISRRKALEIFNPVMKGDC